MVSAQAARGVLHSRGLLAAASFALGVLLQTYMAFVPLGLQAARRRLQFRGPDRGEHRRPGGALRNFNGGAGIAPLRPKTAPAAPAVPPFVLAEGGLMAMVNVASLYDGNIVPTAHRGKKLVLELGANTIYTVKGTARAPVRGPEERALKAKDIFVLSFEPLLNKYIQNLEQVTAWNEEGQLGQYMPDGRGIILPFAVGPDEGLASFGVSSVSGCSSLQEFSAGQKQFAHARNQKKAAQFFSACAHAKVKRTVPVVTLKTVLGWVGGADVTYAKIDIQGMDYAAIASAGDQVKRLQRVMFESPINTHFNSNVPSCQESMENMKKLGFRLGTQKEVEPWAPLKGAFGTPLIYNGSGVTCQSNVAEADQFWVRVDLVA